MLCKVHLRPGNKLMNQLSLTKHYTGKTAKCSENYYIVFSVKYTSMSTRVTYQRQYFGKWNVFGALNDMPLFALCVLKVVYTSQYKIRLQAFSVGTAKSWNKYWTFISILNLAKFQLQWYFVYVCFWHGLQKQILSSREWQSIAIKLNRLQQEVLEARWGPLLFI